VYPLRLLAVAPLAALLLTFALRADDEKKDKDKDKKDVKPANGVLILTDLNGKEHKVTEWKWQSGTRRLSWLATDKDEPEPKEKEKPKKGKQPAAAVGPEAFVFREETTINFAAGVQTLILTDRLRSLSLDADKKMLTVKATGDKDEEVSLSGTTRYTNINWFSLEADVDRGDEGVASFKYQGGSAKGNVKSIRFPAAKVEAVKGTRPVVVQTADKTVKKTHKVSDLMPLYAVGGGREKTSPLLMFRKTLKLDVNKLKSIVDATDDSDEIVWKVTVKDGDETTLTLLEKATIDGQAAQLIGFVGKVPVGYKLFPLRRIAAIHFDATEVPDLPKPDVEKDEKKDKEKKDD
jgi:hypothetical protein